MKVPASRSLTTFGLLLAIMYWQQAIVAIVIFGVATLVWRTGEYALAPATVKAERKHRRAIHRVERYETSSAYRTGFDAAGRISDWVNYKADMLEAQNVARDARHTLKRIQRNHKETR